MVRGGGRSVLKKLINKKIEQSRQMKFFLRRSNRIFVIVFKKKSLDVLKNDKKVSVLLSKLAPLTFQIQPYFHSPLSTLVSPPVSWFGPNFADVAGDFPCGCPVRRVAALKRMDNPCSSFPSSFRPC